MNPSNVGKGKSKWLCAEDDDCIHVVPETDIKPHGVPKNGKADLADMDCPCKPRVDMGGRKPLIIHNSFQDSELIDKAMLKMSNPNVGERWRVEFGEKFRREDGLIDKYCYDKEGEVESTPDAIEKFIENLLEAQLDEVAKAVNGKRVMSFQDLPAHSQLLLDGFNSSLDELIALLQSKRLNKL